ncbi:dihydroxyacetone kinase family protein [Nesterenkonia haasae]|uniref:dihydroxyacetone kinase family protein n=1 Tax=Nesterenkonia haasae TaxID=2587813 RepID=UPI001391944D|nr:dihydroxyacetone kinase family protein [Nesterenkonia haasae]NDK31267.1 DAK2 domain-containing protein [Nesterenkonia haasae]
MKKIINAPVDVVDQYISGLTKGSDRLQRLAEKPIVVRAQEHQKPQSKVALISGGGSGHEPAHAGYVGPGMLDAAVLGPVFTSPSVDDVLTAIRAIGTEAGTLLIVKNYTGDRLNFGLAAELAKTEGHTVEMVIVADDAALGDGSRAGRRGIAGTVLVHKIAGAAAERGDTPAQLRSLVDDFTSGLATVGVGLEACTIPGATESGFKLGPEEFEWGLGIHGEAGHSRGTMLTAARIAEKAVAELVEDRGFSAGEHVAVMVNGLGGTPEIELGVLLNDVLTELDRHRLSATYVWAGNFMTSLDMAGASVTVARVAEHFRPLLEDPVNVPAFPVHSFPLVQEPTRPAPPAESVARSDRTGDEDLSGLHHLVTAVCEALIDAEPVLSEMDRRVGDGDLGLNLRRGAEHVLQHGHELLRESNSADYMKCLSLLVRRSVGGTSGPLYSLGILGLASVEAHGASTTGWAQAAAEGLANIKRLGGAEVGDCTMVDALQPAVEALYNNRSDTPIGTQLSTAAHAARKGVDDTAELQAALGRGSYLGARSTGHRDPGAEAVAVIFAALAETVNGGLSRE